MLEVLAGAALLLTVLIACGATVWLPSDPSVGAAPDVRRFNGLICHPRCRQSLLGAPGIATRNKKLLEAIISINILLKLVANFVV